MTRYVYFAPINYVFCGYHFRLCCIVYVQLLVSVNGVLTSILGVAPLQSLMSWKLASICKIFCTVYICYICVSHLLIYEIRLSNCYEGLFYNIELQHLNANDLYIIQFLITHTTILNTA